MVEIQDHAYLQVAFKIIPLQLHLTGIYFLIKHRNYYFKNNNNNNINNNINNDDSKRRNWLHLINLSTSEIVFVGLGLLTQLLFYNGSMKLATYVETIQYSTCCLQYFLAMIYMTVDRFLEVRLNIIYPVYWKYGYTKILLVSTWVFCGILSLVVLLIELPSRRRIRWIIFVFFYPIIESVFWLLSSSVYIYIFVKLKQNSCHIYKKQTGIMKRRKKRHFYVPALIVLSFVLFILIPDTVITVYMLRNTRLPGPLQTYVYCSYMIGFSCDAVVYIFFSPLVRSKLTLFGHCCQKTYPK